MLLCVRCDCNQRSVRSGRNYGMPTAQDGVCMHAAHVSRSRLIMGECEVFHGADINHMMARFLE